MTQVWCALHPEKEKEKVVKKKKGEKVVKEKKKTRKEKEREEVEEFGTVGERLMKLIVGEKKIYERVLRYEVSLTRREARVSVSVCGVALRSLTKSKSIVYPLTTADSFR